MQEEKVEYTVGNMAEKFDGLTKKIDELERHLDFKEKCLESLEEYHKGYEAAIKDIISTVITELRAE